VIISLLSGIILGIFILNDYIFIASIKDFFTLFFSLLTTPWILKTLGFVILVGSIMSLIEQSGGVAGFVNYVEKKHSLVKSKRSALMLSYIIGVIIFVESSITSLIAGAVGRPLCDKYKISKAKLAYVCDSTSAPISSLIVLNGWGALLLGLISTQVASGMIEANEVEMLIDSVFYNFYAISALLVTFIVVWFDIDIFYMKKSTLKTQSNINKISNHSTSMYFMVLPIFLMVAFVFVFLYITGDGNILQGSGSSSIFYTMISTLIFMLFYYIGKKNMDFKTWFRISFNGAMNFIPIAFILLLAFAIGDVVSDLKTGIYLASLANNSLSVYLLASVIFLFSSIISFSTGTSWGTFSIMIPIAVPMAVGLDANVALCIGAVISGGVFGDHCSPISDTTIISSMASGCDVVEHVKTQLPYALISGIIAAILFVIFSLI
jgi:Na+/H+ antiporter NhaC